MSSAEATWVVLAVLVVAAAISFVWSRVEKKREAVLVAALERLSARGELGLNMRCAD